jgi:hypothetical protein
MVGLRSGANDTYEGNGVVLVRRMPAVALVGLMIPVLLLLPTVQVTRGKPSPVRPEVHTMPLSGVDEPARDEVRDEGGSRAPRDETVVLTARRRTAVYSLLGVTWRGGAPKGMQVSVRTHTEGGWRHWVALESDAEHAPDERSAEARASGVRGGTVPHYAEESDGIQVLITSPDRTTPRDLRLDLVDPGRSPYDEHAGASPSGAAVAAVARPRIVSRAEWGADESLRECCPRYGSTIEVGFVHHTVNTNDYRSSESAGLVRAIYAYHTQSRGWSDIGYNFLVDKYGRIFEGRWGGVNRPVIGAHVKNYNTDSFGVAGLGTFITTAPSTSMINAFSRIVAWKLDLHGRDPLGTTYLNGTRLRVVSGHRDAGSTECPGQRLYDQLPTIRTLAKAQIIAGTPDWAFSGDWDADGVDTSGLVEAKTWRLRNANVSGAPVWSFGYGSVGDVPVPGDWDGDGGTDVGVYRDGVWHLRMSASGGVADLTFAFGRTTDIPIAGDWDGDGKDEPGLFRDGVWYLKWQVGGGSTHDRAFTYGRAGDVPVLGDWDGDGRASPGVVRGATWYLRNRASSGASDRVFYYGTSTDKPVVGDWDADGDHTPGVVRGGTWYLRQVLSGGAADVVFYAD